MPTHPETAAREATSRAAANAANRTAARNNAAWCESLCRTHHRPGEFGDGAWASPHRTPPYYPDAVTLDREAPAEPLLARIDTSPGCTVKDSFAVLDLAPHGFRVLFEARWIRLAPEAPRPAAPGTGPGHPVTTPGELADWEAAWSAPDEPPGLFRAELLADPSVTVLAGRGDSGATVWGAVFNRSDEAVGVSNAWTAGAESGGPSPEALWPAVAAEAETRFPGLPVVGYESGDDLAPALAAGFAETGPLRVWIKDGPSAAGDPSEPAADPVLSTAPPLSDTELDALFAAAWPGHAGSASPAPPTPFHRVLARSLTWVAARHPGDGRLLGFVNVAWDGGAHAFLLDTTVHPDARRRGLGTLLVRRAAEAAREAGAQWLHVDYEEHLEGFYRECGFRPTRAGLIDLTAEKAAEQPAEPAAEPAAE